MVPLIKGHSYQSFRRRLRRCPSQVFIPGVDSGSCYGSHDSMFLQSRMQQPKTRHIIHIRQLIESVYRRQDARDVIRLGRNRRWVSVVVPVFHWIRSSHSYDERITTSKSFWAGFEIVCNGLSSTVCSRHSYQSTICPPCPHCPSRGLFDINSGISGPYLFRASTTTVGAQAESHNKTFCPKCRQCSSLISENPSTGCGRLWFLSPSHP